jgi:hypothetical protein
MGFACRSYFGEVNLSVCFLLAFYGFLLPSFVRFLLQVFVFSFQSESSMLSKGVLCANYILCYKQEKYIFRSHSSRIFLYKISIK